MTRTAVLLVAFVASASIGSAHHGPGSFELNKSVTYQGRLTNLEFINPHSWLYFEVYVKGKGGLEEVRGPGFLPGVLNVPVRHSDKLHVVERFMLNPKTMRITREYTAEGPIYLKGKYSGSDVIQAADAPYTQDTCKEQRFIDYSKQAGR